MDPMMLMMLASGANPGGAGDSMMNPAGSMPMGGAPMANPMGNVGGPGASPAGGMGGLGQMLQGIKAPQADAPKFSGGVSGSGLPYVSRIEDMVSPFLQASGAGKPAMMPTLGQLLAQAGAR